MDCPSSFRPAGDRAAFEGACVTLDLYDDLETLAFDTNTPLIFGLSGLHGRTREEGRCPKCDSKTATSAGLEGGLLLVEARGRCCNEPRFMRRLVEVLYGAVSLGNELCGQGGIAAHLSPSELAADFRRLRGS